MQAWLTQARHSSSVILGVLLAVVCPLIAISARHVGLNLWPDFVSGLSQSSAYTGVLAAGFCAWEAGRWARPGNARLPGSVRSPIGARISHASAVIAPAAGGFLIALAILATIGAVTGTYGAPFGPWLFALGAAQVFACASGYAVGAILGKRWFAPALAAALFLGAFILSRVAPVPYGVRSLFPVILNTDDTFIRYIAPTMWGQAGLFLSASMLLIVLIGGGWRRRRQLVASMGVAALVLAGLAGAGLVIATNGQYVTGHNGRDFVCAGSEPEICLNRGYADAMPSLQESFRTLNERAAGTTLTVTLLEQNGEGVGDAPSPGARSVYVETIDDPGIGLAVSRYLYKYGGLAACDVNSFDPIAYSAVSIVNTWLTGFDELGFDEFDETTPEGAAYARFMDLSVQEGNAWLRANEARYMACSLTFEDLP